MVELHPTMIALCPDTEIRVRSDSRHVRRPSQQVGDGLPIQAQCHQDNETLSDPATSEHRPTSRVVHRQRSENYCSEGAQTVFRLMSISVLSLDKLGNRLFLCLRYMKLLTK